MTGPPAPAASSAAIPHRTISGCRIDRAPHAWFRTRDKRILVAVRFRRRPIWTCHQRQEHTRTRHVRSSDAHAETRFPIPTAKLSQFRSPWNRRLYLLRMHNGKNRIYCISFTTFLRNVRCGASAHRRDRTSIAAANHPSGRVRCPGAPPIARDKDHAQAPTVPWPNLAIFEAEFVLVPPKAFLNGPAKAGDPGRFRQGRADKTEDDTVKKECMPVARVLPEPEHPQRALPTLPDMKYSNRACRSRNAANPLPETTTTPSPSRRW